MLATFCCITNHPRVSLVIQGVKNLPAMCEARFNPWVRKIPRKREWQPTPVFLPGESLGQRNLTGYSPWCHKELDMTEPLHTLTYTNHTKLSVIKRKMFYYVHGVCRSA